MKRLFVTVLGSLLVFITAAAEPPLSKPLFEIEGAFEDAVIHKEHLILSAREAEMGEPDLRVFSLHGKGTPKESGLYYSTGNAHSIALSGQFLLIANGEMGVDIVDLKNLKQPREVASIELEGFSQKVVVSGDFAYVASGFYGMHTIDISNPHAPHLVSTFQAYAPPTKSMLTEEEADGLFADNSEQEGGGALNMGSSENYYDADDLPAYEDVEEEVSLKDIERSDGVMDLLLSGNTAFIAYGSAGIISVDISDPDNIKKLQELRLDWPVERLLLDKGLLHAVTGVGGVQLIDVTQPDRMTLQGNYRTFCYPQDLVRAGKHIYIADGYCGGDGLIAVTVDNDYKTTLKPAYSGDVGNVAASGGMLFSMAPDKVYAFKP
ncbi:MAG: hypothetical protein ABW148_03215 [Sedimenticola sp.]